jgi:AcrR family transcriptional regulator
MEVADARVGRRPYRMVARAEAAQATATRVMEVALALFTEKPYEDVSLEAVAERAGVTKRTVLRRFGSKEELFVQAMEHGGREEMRRRDAVPVGDVAAAVASVIESYERWGANRLRLLAQEDRIPIVAENVEIGRRYHYQWVERTFAPLLTGLRAAERRRWVATLIALTDAYTWKLLRRDLGLSRAETERILVELISKLEGERR